MRFLVKEQRYEKQIAAGQFRYELNGEPTGAVETWRLNAAMDGFEILRVDLDAREADSGHSYIYHLVRQANGHPERLAYRFWGDSDPIGHLEIEGTLLFEERSILGTRSVNGVTYAEDIDIKRGTGFWFPSAVGLGLAATMKSGTAVTLNNVIGGKNTLALKQIDMQVTPMVDDFVDVEIAGKMVKATSWQVSWKDHMRFVLRDEHGWPIKMQRNDQLTAVETRNIWY